MWPSVLYSDGGTRQRRLERACAMSGAADRQDAAPRHRAARRRHACRGPPLLCPWLAPPDRGPGRRGHSDRSSSRGLQTPDQRLSALRRLPDHVPRLHAISLTVLIQPAFARMPSATPPTCGLICGWQTIIRLGFDDRMYEKPRAVKLDP